MHDRSGDKFHIEFFLSSDIRPGADKGQVDIPLLYQVVDFGVSGALDKFYRFPQLF
jgi:hypothetical protein